MLTQEIMEKIKNDIMNMSPEELHKELDKTINCCPLTCMGQCQGSGSCGNALEFSGSKSSNFIRR